MKEYWSIDRFEDDIAIAINDRGEELKLIAKILPQNCKEGDVLYYNGTSYQIDGDETQKRRDEVLSLLDDLFI